MIYRLPKKLQTLWYAVFKWNYRKERLVSIRGFELNLLPSVFHPGLYLSTEIFLDYIISLDLEHVNILELGTGNGLISLYLAKHFDVNVHASDINESAINGVKKNAEKYSLKVCTYLSDLFDEIPEIAFDYIFVNPPFYKKKIGDTADYAFFAGEGLEYFHKLFRQLKMHHLKDAKVFFILSENAVIEEIKEIGKEQGFEMALEKRVMKKGEVFFVYFL